MQSVYPLTGVRSYFAARNWEDGWLGAPQQAEQSTAGGVYQRFEHGWQIHAHSGLSEAYSTHGGIQGYWSSQGWENGWLGYPVSEEIKTAGGVIQYFEHGKVEWKNHKAYGSR